MKMKTSFNSVIYMLFIISISLIFSCKQERNSLDGYVEKDLLSEGIPLKIKAPEDVKVEVSVRNFYKEIKVKNDKGYFLQILSTEKTSGDIASLLSELKEEVKKDPYFSRFIVEMESGFVFEKKTQDGKLNYDFRHIKVGENQQFVFQSGMYGIFTQEQVIKMFKSVH